MGKKEESTKRLRYIRALERFTQGVCSYLFKADEPSKEGFEKKVAQGLKLLERVEKTTLYKGELQDLEQLSDKIQSYIQTKEEIEEIKKDILYTQNQLQKSKNFKKYKKPKHSQNYLKEWE